MYLSQLPAPDGQGPNPVSTERIRPFGILDVRWLGRQVRGPWQGESVTEQAPYPEDDVLLNDEEEHPRRSLWTLASILALVVIIVLVALMFRGCGSDTSGLDNLGGKTIRSVDGAVAVPGVISIWVDEDMPISDVLRVASVRADSVVDLGEGRFLIMVGQGVEESSAERLARQPGVHDVGRVYEPKEDR